MGKDQMKLEIKKLQDATDNLIEQQFYKTGTDTILGRTPEISIKIKNSGLIIKKFKDLFNNNLHFFLEGRYLQFFKPFTKVKGMDENYILEINQEIQIKLAALRGANFDPVLIYTLVLSSLITKIRDIHFNKSVYDIIERVERKAKEMSTNTIHSKLEDLFMKNNKFISLLYNISYLDALAESFHFRKVARTCKIQKSKFINHIVELIVSSTR